MCEVRRVIWLNYKDAIILKVKFESQHRNHQFWSALLVKNYMVVEWQGVNVKKFVFGMVHLFKM